MKQRLILSILLAVAVGSFALLGAFGRDDRPLEGLARVVRAPLTVWSTYEGRLESRSVGMIMSKLPGNPTVIELVPEGTRVSRDQVLVRFESSELEREVLKLERDHALARSELESLKNAEIPLELRDLKTELLKTRTLLGAERQYLDASIELSAEALVSEQEVEQQRLKVVEIETQLETLELRLELTEQYLHPSLLRSTEAKLASIAQERDLSRERLRQSTVLSPRDGVVVYKSLPIGNEFRPVRVGDRVFPNQPFMVLPDMSDLVVHLEVPEGELTRIGEGKLVFVQPLAYPDLRLRGVVETIASMAQSVPGQPSWQKSFHVVLALDDVDSRLRPGMSITAHIRSYRNPNALLISRSAVRWKDGKPFARVVTRFSYETRELVLGSADEASYEILEGLQLDDEVLVE